MTIHQLEPDGFSLAADVLAEIAEWNVYLTAGLHHTSPGRIYVDDRTDPQSVFAVSLDCAYLAGNPHNDAFNAGVTQVLEATLFAGNRVNPADPELVFCVDSLEWEQALADILSHWRWPPIWGSNHFYLFKTPHLDWRHALPPGYEIARLDAALLAAQGDKLPKNIADSIRIGWQNQENFLQNGFGFVARQNSEVVCWCLADVTVGTACEIGIETAVAPRQTDLLAQHPGPFTQQKPKRHPLPRARRTHQLHRQKSLRRRPYHLLWRLRHARPSLPTHGPG